MKILNKLAIKNLKLNRKRTISTIIGIILSTALICAVSTIATSFRESLIRYTVSETGYYHIELSDVGNDDYESLKNNRDIKDIKVVNELGYSILPNSQNEYKPYLRIVSMDKKDFEGLSFKLIEGRFPQNENEIVISDYIKSNGKVTYNIGDKISLNIGERKTLDGYELNSNNSYVENEEKLVDTYQKEFVVVGIIERPNYSFENYNIPGYTTITTNIDSNNKKLYISLNNPKNYKEDIAQILGVSDYTEIENFDKVKFENYSINEELLRWEVFAVSDNTLSMLYAVVGVVIFIIIFTSVFCIKNSFAIATTEKIKMYGMLASVGTTKKQIRQNVLFEAMILGIIAIPLGIILGIFASYILIRIMNYLLLDLENLMVLKISILSIVISVILGFITIYLSARSSAKKASKVSPIENLRNSNEIKINSKKLKTSKIIKIFFGIGGVLANKNLKRNRKKYRTTVISLAVSIAIFITMSSFIYYAFGSTNLYYKNFDYNVVITGNSTNKLTQTNIDNINSLDNIQEKHYAYYSKIPFIVTDLEKVEYKDAIRDDMYMYYENENEADTNFYNNEKYVSLTIIALDDESFEKYAKKIGADYEKIKDKAILSDTVRYIDDNGKTIERRIYNFKEKDVLKGQYKNNEYEIEIGNVTNIMPYGYEQYNFNGGVIVLNYNLYNKIFDFYLEKISIQSNNSENLVENIKKLNLDVYINNYDEMVKSQKSIYLLISIFLYGFIIVITLIGVTNIFNTITSNMELRQKEFAMLKSIGMTKKEFNRMINLETIMYSSKSLIYGIILGLIGTFAIYKAFAIKLDSGLYIPYGAIVISILAVFILVFLIMKYSITKINKQNIIETIRKENI